MIVENNNGIGNPYRDDLGRFTDKEGAFHFPQDKLDSFVKEYSKYRKTSVEKLPIDKLFQDNDLGNDEDLESYHKKLWNDAKAKDFHIDPDKISNMYYSDIPFVTHKKDGTYQIADGRHRTRALYNDGYQYVYLPVIEENDTIDKENNESKEKQFEIIQNTNPMQDDYHVGIRSVDDIKSAKEVFEENTEESYSYPDFTEEDGKNALESGKIKIYSSKPIENGAFVSPSKMAAQDYAGSGQVYEQEVDIDDVAWINGDEGQLASEKFNKDNIIKNLFGV